MEISQKDHCLPIKALSDKSAQRSSASGRREVHSVRYYLWFPLWVVGYQQQDRFSTADPAFHLFLHSFRLRIIFTILSDWVNNSWGGKESDTTERLNWTELKYLKNILSQVKSTWNSNLSVHKVVLEYSQAHSVRYCLCFLTLHTPYFLPLCRQGLQTSYLRAVTVFYCFLLIRVQTLVVVILHQST